MSLMSNIVVTIRHHLAPAVSWLRFYLTFLFFQLIFVLFSCLYFITAMFQIQNYWLFNYEAMQVKPITKNKILPV